MEPGEREATTFERLRALTLERMELGVLIQAASGEIVYTNRAAEACAEGVETADQLSLLRELGVDKVSGYHLCRPRQHRRPRWPRRGGQPPLQLSRLSPRPDGLCRS